MKTQINYTQNKNEYTGKVFYGQFVFDVEKGLIKDINIYA